jgi:hypothetical protein
MDLESGHHERPESEEAVVTIRQRFARELGAFEAAFRERIAAHEPPDGAFRGAAESALSGLCDPIAITNVVLGIAADFDSQSGTDIRRDANALPRLAAAYLESLEKLVQRSVHEIELPFLSSTSAGPIHFRQRVTIARLAELAQTPPAPTPASPPWWKRILG